MFQASSAITHYVATLISQEKVRLSLCCGLIFSLWSEEMNQLEALKQHTTVVADSGDTGDIPLRRLTQLAGCQRDGHAQQRQ